MVIKEMKSRTIFSNMIKSYGYNYDGLNRLLNAKYYAGNDLANTDRYNETLQYDKNGNIVSLNRYGTYNTHKQLIDDLLYEYTGNQLMNVNESNNGHNVAGFKDGNLKSNTGLNDYQYDNFGNMNKDRNKGITNINYNHLNLPSSIVFNDNVQTSINYIYNAAGVKVKKVANLGTTNNVSGTSLTDYLGGYQYNNGTLQFFPHAQGYVKHTVNPSSGASEFDYVYQYKDHLGNIRVNYALDPNTQVVKVLEENHYYPFGLKHQENLQGRSIRFVPSSLTTSEWVKGVGFLEPAPVSALVPNSGYAYKFQNQERQDELGLNWDSFKWRNYDFAIGRFMNVDPLAPDYPQWAPYVFSGNLVVVTRELEGLEPSFLIDENGKLTTGSVSLLNAAFGFSTSSLKNSTWIVNSDPRMSLGDKGWFKATDNPEATVKGTKVIYNKKVANEKPNYWLGLIAHEQSHRTDVERDGNLSFYNGYIFEGIFRGYKGIGTEKDAFRIGSDDNNIDLTDKLLSYKNGAVMDIFQRGNLTDNQKASMLETVGNQFKRDVILEEKKNGFTSSLSSIKNMQMNEVSKNYLISILNNLISQVNKEQDEITKKYGK